jgi:hypothetical protein
MPRALETGHERVEHGGETSLPSHKGRIARYEAPRREGLELGKTHIRRSPLLAL